MKVYSISRKAELFNTLYKLDQISYMNERQLSLYKKIYRTLMNFEIIKNNTKSLIQIKD